MNNMPLKLKEELNKDPYFKKCARSSEGGCSGRITFEHAFTWKGKQLQKAWAICPLCTFHHSVCENVDSGALSKEINVYLCLNRATNSELLEVSKAIDYIALKARLNKKYEKRT